MVRSKPRITEFTVRSLRRPTLAALGLAIESSYLGMLKEPVSRLHHSMRRLIRDLYTLLEVLSRMMKLLRM